MKNCRKFFLTKNIDVLHFDSSKGATPTTGVQGFRLPPTFSLLWTLGPTQFDSLECPFLFLLSFLSGHSETPPDETGGVFLLLICAMIYFSNTANSSQCALPTNWSTGISLRTAYPPSVNTRASRINVCGLQDT